MQDMIDRLRGEHEDIAGAIRALLPRVGRRPVSRLALEDTLRLLDTRVAPHERDEEEKLFPRFGAATDPLEPVLEAHAAIEEGRKALRDALADWLAGAAGADPEALACRAEEVLHQVLEHFQAEERQVFTLARVEAAPAPATKAARA